MFKSIKKSCSIAKYIIKEVTFRAAIAGIIYVAVVKKSMNSSRNKYET